MVGSVDVLVEKRRRKYLSESLPTACKSWHSVNGIQHHIKANSSLLPEVASDCDPQALVRYKLAVVFFVSCNGVRKTELATN
jgi:hypothetical protein